MSDEKPYWPTIEVPLGLQLHGPDLDEDARMLIGLGSVVREASAADHTLRTLYCALIGSPYAVVTAAGQMTGELVTDCLALIKAKQELAPQDKETIKGLLVELQALSAKRNRFVHDLWGAGPNGTELIRSSRGKKELTSAPVALNDLVETARGILSCSNSIFFWLADTLPDAVAMEAQLRWIESLTADREGDGEPQIH